MCSTSSTVDRAGLERQSLTVRPAGHRIEDGLDLGFEDGNIVAGGPEHAVPIDAGIIVNGDVPHADHFQPGYFGVALAEFSGEAVRCLADDLEMPQDMGLQRRVGEERRLGSGKVVHNHRYGLKPQGCPAAAGDRLSQRNLIFDYIMPKAGPHPPLIDYIHLRLK